MQIARTHARTHIYNFIMVAIDEELAMVPFCVKLDLTKFHVIECGSGGGASTLVGGKATNICTI